jgi:hypothetical protein
MTEPWVAGWLMGLTIFMVVLYILMILVFTTDLDDRSIPNAQRKASSSLPGLRQNPWARKRKEKDE